MLKYIVIFGSALQFIGILSYVKETIKGKNKPDKVTWLMWSVAPLIATFASISEGVSWAVLPVFMAGFGPLLVFAASFVNREAYWKLHRMDYICGIFSILALVLWGITKQPEIAIIFSILSDGFAAIPTLVKSIKYPETESLGPYITSLISSSTSFFAFNTFQFSEIAFPIYLVIINILLISAILRGRRKN